LQGPQPVAGWLAGMAGIILVEEFLDSFEIRQMRTHVFKQNTAQDVYWNKGEDISYRVSENQRQRECQIKLHTGKSRLHPPQCKWYGPQDPGGIGHHGKEVLSPGVGRLLIQSLVPGFVPFPVSFKCKGFFFGHLSGHGIQITLVESNGQRNAQFADDNAQKRKDRGSNEIVDEAITRDPVKGDQESVRPQSERI
jgi:hypothetical protein